MKNFLRSALLITIISGGGTVLAQMRNLPLPMPVAEQVRLVGGNSVLDPTRFSMQHGFSFSMATGGLGSASGMGVYTNTINYLITDAVILSSQIHLVQSGVGMQPGVSADGISMYYQAALNWRISRNVNFSLGLSNIPRYYGATPYSYLQRRNANLHNPYIPGR